MPAFHLPDNAQLDRYLAGQSALPFTYPHTGATLEPVRLSGFDHDSLRVALGQGPVDYARACAAIRHWRMFPDGWTRILPRNAPIRPGVTVAMYAHLWGFWWSNACRIVYTLEEPDRFGFAYGTLPGHMECGEEIFCVSRDPEGRVWYELRAFSRPRHWMARLAYPMVRHWQARFRRESAAQMQDFVGKS